MASRFSLFNHPILRSLVVVVAIAALAACGETGDGPASPTSPTATDAGAAADANLTEDCVDDYEADTDYFPDKLAFDAASGVEVSYEDSYKTVTVTRPWADADTQFTYVLVQCGAPTPDDVPDDVAEVIEVPVERLVTMSTTYLPAVDLLDAVDRLAGVGDASFVYTEAVREAVAAGDVVETGEHAEADLEVLLSLDPDAVMTYSFGDPSSDGVSRMVEAGLPVVLNGDFNEETPLGRAEWLKFVALFLNQEARADDIFATIADDYERLATEAAAAGDDPSVFLSTPFEGTWYMPRGDTATGALLDDAGADYVFAGEAGEAAGTGNLALDVETVLDRAADADFWLNTGTTASTLEELAGIDERFRNFDAFQEGDVYAETRRMSPDGGVDYYETGHARPDLVLADLVSIFHPDVLPDHDLVFYQRLGRTSGDGGDASPGETPGAEDGG